MSLIFKTKPRPPNHCMEEFSTLPAKVGSGTTLLGMVCGLIDDHVFVGDLKTVWDEGVHRNYLCGCGIPFRECPFWSSVIRHAYGSIEAC